MAELHYYELTRAAHFEKVAANWYRNFVQAEINKTITNINSPLIPYGNRNTANSPIIELSESLAYYMGHFQANEKYWVNYTAFHEQHI